GGQSLGARRRGGDAGPRPVDPLLRGGGGRRAPGDGVHLPGDGPGGDPRAWPPRGRAGRRGHSGAADRDCSRRSAGRRGSGMRNGGDCRALSLAAASLEGTKRGETMLNYRSAGWRYWLGTAALLAAALAGIPGALPAVLVLCIVQAMHFRLTEGSIVAFPVQVRLAYLALL